MILHSIMTVWQIITNFTSPVADLPVYLKFTFHTFFISLASCLHFKHHWKQNININQHSLIREKSEEYSEYQPIRSQDYKNDWQVSGQPMRSEDQCFENIHNICALVEYLCSLISSHDQVSDVLKVWLIWIRQLIFVSDQMFLVTSPLQSHPEVSRDTIFVISVTTSTLTSPCIRKCLFFMTQWYPPVHHTSHCWITKYCLVTSRNMSAAYQYFSTCL